MGHNANSADPDQMQQNGASDQGFHCFLTDGSIKNLNKNEKYHPTSPFKWKWTGPTDKGRKVHSA